MSLKIGLVGVGPWGAHVLRDLRSLGATVHAVARSPESIERAHKGGAASVVGAPNDLPPCDGYVIANRTSSHLDALEDLIGRDAPIYVEKPLSNDVARAKRLPPAAFDLVFVMHKWRYHPGVLELARIARSGEFGPVLGLRAVRYSWGKGHPDVSSLWTLAPHDLSIALEILGEVPRFVSAMADPLAVGGDGAIAQLEAGVPVVIDVSSGQPIRTRRILLYCRDATCQIDSADYGKVFVFRPGEDEASLISVADDMPLKAELRAFLDHVAGGAPPKTPLADELKIISLIAEIEAATARG